MMDTGDICGHDFENLLRDDNGFWLCMCGATGTLEADFDRKLKFVIPSQNLTRQQRRKWERKTTKDYLKRLKKSAQTTT